MKAFPRQDNKGVIICLILILLLGSFLRFHRVGEQSLWTDEISGALISSSSVSEIISRNLSPEKAGIPVEEPPLPYILMHYSIKFSENEFMLRLPFVIFGILSIWAIFLVARLFFGNSTALLSAFLLSISFYHILYSQEARGYSALIFFSLMSLFFICKAATQDDTRSWIGFSIATTFNIYSHYSALQVLVIESLIFAIIITGYNTSGGQVQSLLQAKNKIIRYVFSILLVGILMLPILSNFLQTMNSRLGGTTIPLELNPIYFANLLARYGAGNGEAFYIYNFLFLFGVVWAFASGRKKEMAAMVLWLVFPFIILSTTGYKYFFHIRYVFFIFPIYLIFVAHGAVGLFESKFLQRIIQKLSLGGAVRPGWIYGTVCLILFGWLSITPLQLYYQMPARMTDWKGIAKYIKENYQPGTLILIESPFCIHELGYYLKDTKPRIEVYSVGGNSERFKEIVSNFKNVWYVDCNPVFDPIVRDLFKDRKTFTSPAFAELGKRELIDWDKSWFPASNIRRYYPTLYYNNAHDGISPPEAGKHSDMQEDGQYTNWPQIVKHKDYGLRLNNLPFDAHSLNSLNCYYETLLVDNLYPYALKVHFDGGPEEDEYVEMELPIDKPLDLNRYPILEITYRLEDSNTQAVEAIAGIDYTGDGIVDYHLKVYATPENNASKSGDTFDFASIQLLRIIQERFSEKTCYTLTTLKLRARKLWGKNLSNKEGSYPYIFQFKSVGLLGIPSSVKINIKEGGKYILNISAQEDIGGGPSVRKLSYDKPNLDCVNCDYKILPRDDKLPYALKAHFDGGPEEDEYIEMELSVDKPIDLNRYPTLEITYRLEDSNTQAVEVLAGIDYTGDGIADSDIEAYNSPAVTFEKLKRLPDEVKFPDLLKHKISYDADKKFLIFKGAMKEEERNKLLALSQEPLYQEAVKTLFRNSAVVYLFNNSVLSVNLLSKAQTAFPGMQGYVLTTLKLRARKFWGRDLRFEKGSYTFEFRGIKLLKNGIKEYNATDYEWSTTPGALTYGCIDSGTCVIIEGPLKEDFYDDQVISFHRPSSVNLKKYPGFSVPIKIKNGNRRSVEMSFEIDINKDGLRDFCVKKTVDDSGQQFVRFDLLEAAKSLCKKSEDFTLVGIKTDLIYKGTGHKSVIMSQIKQAPEETSSKEEEEEEEGLPGINTFSIGQLVLADNAVKEKTASPNINIIVGGNTYKLQHNDKPEESAGILKFSTTPIGLKKGQNNISVISNQPQDLDIRLVEILRCDSSGTRILAYHK